MIEGETAFLRHLLLACGTTESRSMDEKLWESHQHERCVRRAMWWVFQLILIALAGLGYTTVLLQDLPADGFDFLVRLFSRLGFGSTISLVGFFCLWLGYRRQLSCQRKACRRFITRILHSCWERSNTVSFPVLPEGTLQYPRGEQQRQALEF